MVLEQNCGLKDGVIMSREYRGVMELIIEKCLLDLALGKSFIISERGVSVESLDQKLGSCVLRSGWGMCSFDIKGEKGQLQEPHFFFYQINTIMFCVTVMGTKECK